MARSSEKCDIFGSWRTGMKPLVAALLPILLLVQSAEARSAICTDPNDGLRECDSYDTDCPLSIFPEPPLFVPGYYRADYSSYSEAFYYLGDLDDLMDPDGVMEMTAMNLPLVPYVDENGIAQQLKFILVKLSTDASYGPDEDKPDVLITCGTHPREWATSESCLAFIDYMVKEVYSPLPDPEVAELLESLEIWVVPFVSPGGRYYDDDRFGDPSGYGWGDPDVNAEWRKNRQWSDVFDCASSWGTRDFSGKCDTSTPENHYGINVARNFSAGWDQYPPDGNAAVEEKCMDIPSGGVDPAPISCAEDSQCQNLLAYPGPFLSPKATSTPQCVLNPNIFCDKSGECAFNRRRTCCDTNFGGLRPFESIEARLIRHIALNMPIVTVLEAHSFNGILSKFSKRGPYPEGSPQDPARSRVISKY